MLMVCTSERTALHRAGCSKRPSSKAAGESKPEAYPLGYVEDFDESRTPLAAFFSILLSNRFMNCDQFRSIRERSLNLQFMNHLRNARHNILLLEEGGAIGHEG